MAMRSRPMFHGPCRWAVALNTCTCHPAISARHSSSQDQSNTSFNLPGVQHWTQSGLGVHAGRAEGDSPPPGHAAAA